jgi:hypothetical protein
LLDRESGIVGAEWAVVDLRTNQIVALRRDFTMRVASARTYSARCNAQKGLNQGVLEFVNTVFFNE